MTSSRSGCTASAGWKPTLDAEGKERTRRHYRAPTIDGSATREAECSSCCASTSPNGRRKATFPAGASSQAERSIEPIRTRGWTHWHHLFTPTATADQWACSPQTAAEPTIQTSSRAAAYLLESDDWPIGTASYVAGGIWRSPAKEKDTDLLQPGLNTLYNHCVTGPSPGTTAHVFLNWCRKASVPRDRSQLVRCDARA